MGALPAEALLPVWKALADPNRRRILDLLRERPRTTGELAERFELSRFGVMKHLGILVEAGLVMVRRQGRQRWNHLNPMPIHEISRRWIKPFESAYAGRLLRLKQHAELHHEEFERMSDVAEFRSLDVQLEVSIAAPPDRVWRSLTTGLQEWWPAKFYVGETPRRFVMEPRLGGLVYEDWGGGEGAVWGSVTAFQTNRLLQWTGDMSADFGGPARTVTTFRLTERDPDTLLTFRDTPYGCLQEGAVEGLPSGWRWLLEDNLKPWLEEGRRPERPQSLEEAAK